MTPAECIAAVRLEHEQNGDTVVTPWPLYEVHPWLLVLRENASTVLLVSLPAGDDLALAQALGQHDNRQVVQIVNITSGIVFVPVLEWLQPTCAWPGCVHPRMVGAMQFQDGRLCHDHRAEAQDLTAEARP